MDKQFARVFMILMVFAAHASAQQESDQQNSGKQGDTQKDRAQHDRAQKGAVQKSNAQDLGEKLAKIGQIDLAQSRLRLIQADYKFNEKNVESIIVRPIGEGTYPGLLLVPGYSKTARDYLPLAIHFAKEGYAVITITQPGFGNSQADADFVGPNTIRTLAAGLETFCAQDFVDAKRIGVLGYSRGAMAASLLATSGVEIQAGVFAAGIYDLEKAYHQITLEGIKANIRNEAGNNKDAFAVRSSIHKMAKLNCPVLILHGAKDINAPVEQAFSLQKTLEKENKSFEIMIFETNDHSIGMKNLSDNALAFFSKHLKK